MNKGFTVKEQEELNKASNALNLDAETKKQAFAYFLEYKTKTKQTTVEKLPLFISCAILAAAKSQVLTTVQGDTIRGVGISITQLLRSLEMSNNPSNIDELLFALKDFIAVVTLQADIMTELKTIIDKFAFSYTFFIKFNSLFRQLELDQPMSEHEEYLRLVKNFGWLIYINSRVSILQSRTELVESVFLLAGTLSQIIYGLPNKVPVPYFEKNGRKLYLSNSQTKDEEAIQEGILELLKLTASSAEDVASHQKSLNDFLKKLIENGVLRSTQGTETQGIYDASILAANFEKLDGYYQKKLGFDDLDERFFIRDRKQLQSGMFTPFAKQGAANKLSININITKNGDLSQSMKQNFPSQRMLNFGESEQFNMKSNLNEFKQANKQVPASPQTKLPPATPVTKALEMYNWLSDKVKLKKNSSGLTPTMENYLSSFDSKFKEEILNRANTTVDKVLEFEKEAAAKTNTTLNEKKFKDKQNQMVSLYLKVLEELLNQEERKTRNPNYYDILSNVEFHKALIACSVETVFFVNNSSSINFTKLLEICDIQPFEFWRIIGSFAKFDPQIPFPIKKHLHTLELKILLCLAWKKGSVVHNIVKKFIEESKSQSPIELENAHDSEHNESEENSQISQEDSEKPQRSTSNSAIQIEKDESHNTKTELTHSQELFFKRVLHHTALHIYQISELLGINEKIAEQIWSVMKYILSSETTLLINRHIDQLILSTVYGACKVLHHPLKFQEIIAKYQELPAFDKSDFIDTIHQVYISETERADLIKFYNSVYILQMKNYLFSLTPQPGQPQIRPGTPQIKKPLVPALVMSSPLRESLPLQMAQMAPYKSHSAHAKSSTGTPLAKYGMTPRTGALYAFGESPCRALETINNLASKRQINFDDGPEKEDSKGDFIVKKAKTSSSIMDKIIEQRGEEDEIKTPASKTNLFSSASGISKFASYDDDSSNDNSTGTTPLNFSKKGFGFELPSLLQSKSKLDFQIPRSSSNMSVEGEQQISQNQSDSPNKKVEKKNSDIAEETTKA